MAIIPTLDIVERPEAHGYDGSIDNVLIRLAVSPETPLEDITAEAAPPRIDTAEGAEDIRDETGRRYSRSDLSGGAGLDFLHSPRRPDDAPIRFWSSRGVDVFGTDRGDIYDSRLLRSVEEYIASATIVDVASVDGTVYYATATNIYLAGTGSVATHTGCTKMVALGNSLYTLDSTGIARYDVPDFTRNSVSSVTTYTNIWAVKSRIVSIEGNVLSDATDDSILLTLPSIDTVTDVLDAGPAIIVLGTTGSIYVLTLDQNLALVPAGESPFTDEIPILAAESFGIIGIVTAQTTEAGGKVARFYTGTLGVSGSYDIEDLQLIFQVGDRDTTDDLTPYSMHATRDSIYIAIPEAGETATTLWRYYLPTGGYARGLEIDTGSADTVRSFLIEDDRLWAAVDTEGLWLETDEYVPTGYIIGPLADFFTSEDKQWVGADLSAVALPTGASLELYDTTDPALINDPTNASWQLVIKLLATQTQTSITDLVGRDSRFHAAQIIYRSDSTRDFTPALQSYSFRALPNPARDILLRVPINVSDQIESPGRRAVTIPGRGAAIESALRAYEGQQVLIELFRPNLQIRGLIERFESVITTIPSLGSVRRVMYARIRGTRLEDSEGVTTFTSGASLGQDTLGRALLGQGVVNT